MNIFKLINFIIFSFLISLIYIILFSLYYFLLIIYIISRYRKKKQKIRLKIFFRENKKLKIYYKRIL